MGIRIHKILGYGLTNVKHTGTSSCQIADPRFNPNGYMGVDYEEREERWTMEGYKIFLQNKYEEMKDSNEFGSFNYLMEKECIKSEYLHRSITYDAEFGLSNVFCLTPASQINQWYRYDDMLDYVENVYLKPKIGNCNYVKRIKENLYPWDCLWCDSRIGEQLPFEKALAYRRLKSLSTKENPYYHQKDKLAIQLGFEDHKQCDRFFKPMVPPVISMLCDYCKIFTNPAIIRQLQPLLYVYWS